MLFPSLHPSGRRPSKYKISGAMVPLKSQRTEFPLLFYLQPPPVQTVSPFPCCTMPWQCKSPFSRANPSPFPEPGTCLAGPFTCNFFDIPASRQLRFFPFLFLLIFEALISEMYGIIGLYCLAIYLCLSLSLDWFFFPPSLKIRCCHCSYLAITIAHIALNY